MHQHPFALPQRTAVHRAGPRVDAGQLAQPLVTVRRAVRSAQPAMPPRVRTAAALTLQSTVTDSISAAEATRPWLSR
jgi:hypothetical protein